jgi:hypothetical protein
MVDALMVPGRRRAVAPRRLGVFQESAGHRQLLEILHAPIAFLRHEQDYGNTPSPYDQSTSISSGVRQASTSKHAISARSELRHRPTCEFE